MTRFIKTVLIALPLALGIAASLGGAGTALAMESRGGGDSRGGNDNNGGNDGSDGGLICARLECMAPVPAQPQRNETCDSVRVFVPTGYGTGYFERRCRTDLQGRM